MLKNDGTPWYFNNGEWSPICGHDFWNNHHGATAFCQKLGYRCGLINYYRGDVKKNGKRFDVDAFEIGQCNKGESLDSCTGYKNNRLGDTPAAYAKTERCRKGEKVGFRLLCDGHPEKTEKNSCRGNVLVPN